jgi:hypothetical protein
MGETRTTVEQALADWRAAERAVETTDPEAPELEGLVAAAAVMSERYQRAVLGARGRVDQLEAAADDTWERVQVSRDQFEQSRSILRRR